MGWMREMNRAQEAEAGRAVTDVDTWDGQENDDWWQQQRAKHDQIRGRG